MTKKLLILIALVAISFQTTSCTSNKSQDETDVIENADVDKIEAEDNLATNTDAVPEESDASMQAALGEAPPADLENLDVPTDTAQTDSAASLPAEAPPANVAAAPTLDENSLGDVPELPPIDAVATNEPAPEIINNAPPVELPPPVTATAEPTPQEASEPALQQQASEPTPTTESASVIENSGTNMAMMDSAPSSFAPSIKSSGRGMLKKISSTAPYKTAGGWVNTVYVARPGETLKDISQKIFASDKTKELKKIAENSFLKSRSAKPGDKIYYVSPNRPDDSVKTLMYYEDMGMVPEMYVVQKGDNLKKVAKQILGYDKAYVEMWTSNPVESKTKLTEGDTLRYWKSASGVTTAMQNGNQNQAAQLIDSAQTPPVAEGQNMAENTLPPTADTAANLPPPTDQNIAANTAAPAAVTQMPPAPDATASLPPPPPPPPAEIAPPPPVEDMAAMDTTSKKKKNIAEEEAAPAMGVLDNDTMMSLGAVGVLTAALAFVLIRRKKKKAAEQAAATNNEMNIG